MLCYLFMYVESFNPFVASAPFLYPLKISENLPVFWCFQGLEKRCIGNKWFDLFKVFRCITLTNIVYRCMTLIDLLFCGKQSLSRLKANRTSVYKCYIYTCSRTFRNIHRKTPFSECLFNKETSTQDFTCQFLWNYSEQCFCGSPLGNYFCNLLKSKNWKCFQVYYGQSRI